VARADLEEVFYSAAALLGETPFLNAKYKDYAGLKARAELKNGRVTVAVSRGFRDAPREVLLGLALHLLSGLYRKRVDTALVRPYKEFVSGKGAAELSNALRGAHGRDAKGEAKGENHDLDEMLDGLYRDYSFLFEGVKKPHACWSKLRGRRRLGWFDDAFHKIVLNKGLDRAPRFVAEYVLFHELLHAKHDVLYGRGKSLRRAVHTAGFKKDEWLYAHSREAEEWLKRNWR